MTRTLILMRHAKSDWDDPLLDDHDRPLNARGNRDAPRIGRWMAENDLRPDRALCSSATRAQQTLEGLGLTIPTTPLTSLYMASPSALLKAVRAANGQCVLVVAHNPGIGMLANHIVAAKPNHPRFGDYPTAATLVADIEVNDWSDLQDTKAQARTFVTPHDLPE